MSGSYWNGSTYTAIGGGWNAERVVPRGIEVSGRSGQDSPRRSFDSGRSGDLATNRATATWRGWLRLFVIEARDECAAIRHSKNPSDKSKAGDYTQWSRNA
jgi:hypothetical protein